MLSQPISPEPADDTDQINEMTRLGNTRCLGRKDGAQRLRDTLRAMGTDVEHEAEQGLSGRQGAIEGLIRSVARYLQN